MPAIHGEKLGFSRVAPELGRLERTQDCFLQRHRDLARVKLRWRSLCIKHFLHVLPGEAILQIGAGSGIWTAELSSVLGFRNPVVAVVFSPELLQLTPALDNVCFVAPDELEDTLPWEHFDYVVGSMTIPDGSASELFAVAHRLLKPGGQIFFFEPNSGNPIKKFSALYKQGNGRSTSCSGLLGQCREAGFLDSEAAPYDILPWILHPQTALRVQAKAFPLEHAPLFRKFTQCVYLSAQKPGVRRERLSHNLAEHRALEGTVSVVLPCHNEAANIPNLTRQILAFYGPYIHEILIVNDGSSDATVETVLRLSLAEPRIKLINRSQPNGVGLALRDGYQGASGRYILSMDCDFVSLLPEVRALFDIIIQGRDGAIGSRFSHESVVLNYPFSKLLCNRLLHVLIRLFLRPGTRDVTNNLKLYRSEILKTLKIDSRHFSANLEIGLKPLLEGYDITEVPISWTDRTADMGTSTFKIHKVGVAYICAFLKILATYKLRRVNNFIKRQRDRLERIVQSINCEIRARNRHL